MSDPVLVALTQVEHSLENVVIPSEGKITGITNTSGDVIGFTSGETLPFTQGDAETDVEFEAKIQKYKTGGGQPQPAAEQVKDLLKLLYQIPFVPVVGQHLADVLGTVIVDLRKLADKIGPSPDGGLNLDTVTEGIEGLQVILNAIKTLPGVSESSAELNKAIDILTQVIGLLHDIPSARVELYAIAQQLSTIKSAFADPNADFPD